LALHVLWFLSWCSLKKRKPALGGRFFLWDLKVIMFSLPWTLVFPPTAPWLSHFSAY
jgi:hypothetical protein